MTLRYSTDIVIFGGGIAGLWLLNRLRQDGYHAILFETRALGSGQTLASQGIIHGGLKYALSGALSGASQAIAGMPARWRDLLSGNSSPDLSGVQVLSDHYYMWSGGGIRSKLKSFLGSKSLRGRIDTLQAQDYPDFFKAATVDGNLYRLPDFVVNTESLVAVLRQQADNAVFKIDPGTVEFSTDADGAINGCRVTGNGKTISLDTQRIILAAGEGNRALMEAADFNKVAAQERPLNMVYLQKADLPRLFVHCIGSDFSLTPRLTVTSHSDANGMVTWYLGGELAEQGVGKSDAKQIAAAQKELSSLFPWVDLNGANWQCFHINRAEPANSSNHRPDDAFCLEDRNIILTWPTKLTLTPALADRVIEMLHSSGMKSTATDPCPDLQTVLPAAEIANPRWH